MAKKSLKKRIDDLVYALGRAKKPTFLQIRNELFPIGIEVEALENGRALAEQEATIKALKSENENLEVELQTANAEIKRFRVGQRKQEQEDRDLPEVQFQILKRLPSEYEGISWKVSEISYVARIPMDEVEIHVQRLSRAGLVKADWSYNATAWRRTIAGSGVVVARRLDDEGQPGPKRHKHADLRKAAQEALLLIARSEEGIEEFEFSLRCGRDGSFDLDALASISLVTGEFRHGLRGGRTLFVTLKGLEYLTECGLL